MSDMENRCKPYREKLKGEPYASVVPSRTPEVKYHGSIARAKSAVGYRQGWWDKETDRYQYGTRGGEIYKRTTEDWELVHRVEKGTPFSELPWKEEN
ncbi:hypothetical protein [Streptomyces sp. NPDC055036]